MSENSTSATAAGARHPPPLLPSVIVHKQTIESSADPMSEQTSANPQQQQQQQHNQSTTQQKGQSSGISTPLSMAHFEKLRRAQKTGADAHALEHKLIQHLEAQDNVIMEENTIATSRPSQRQPNHSKIETLQVPNQAHGYPSVVGNSTFGGGHEQAVVDQYDDRNVTAIADEDDNADLSSDESIFQVGYSNKQHQQQQQHSVSRLRPPPSETASRVTRQSHAKSPPKRSEHSDSTMIGRRKNNNHKKHWNETPVELDELELPEHRKSEIASIYSVDISNRGKRRADAVAAEQKKKDNRPILPASSYFNDGCRRIDYVLVYKYSSSGSRKKKRQNDIFRRRFEQQMRIEGLELEIEPKESSLDQKTIYVKVHSTSKALCRQAELDKLQMPTQVSDLPKPSSSLTNKIIDKLFKRNPFKIQDEFKIDETIYFTDAFERDRMEDFLIEDPDTMFTPAERGALTWSLINGIQIKVASTKKMKKNKSAAVDVLSGSIDGSADYEQQRKAEEERRAASMKAINMAYMLRAGLYSRAFPLHDSDPIDTRENDYSKIPIKKWPFRRYLYEAWARPRQWCKYQPIEQIRQYYGEKMGMYFAWLGFYTQMLIIPTFVGLITFMAGLFNSLFVSNIPEWFCNENNTYVFCRDCATASCPFAAADSMCNSARFATIFDNYGATFFSIFMAIWAVVFMELWKRRQAELASKWNVGEREYIEPQIRPDYNLNSTETRINEVTQLPEPYLPRRSAIRRMVASCVTVLVFLTVVLGLMVSVMFYKRVGPLIWNKVLQYKHPETGLIKYKISPGLVISVTASLANGLCIAIMGKIYLKVAFFLTHLEMPRTDQQFEHSYTYKVTLFQFVNYYGALFYLVFIRSPAQLNPIHAGDTKADRCPPTGCMLDVALQLFIIMTGKQAINNILELGVPLIQNFMRRRGTGKETELAEAPRWQKDNQLNSPPAINLFGDYMEMLIQYGFVTMFVAAFPLAPLFALLNNIIEIRLDAYKTLTQTQKAVPVRVSDIEPWLGLLEITTKVAVFTNAIVIAFTTSFIDNLVYDQLHYSERKRYGDFMNFTLTPFETINWCKDQPESNDTSFADAASSLLGSIGLDANSTDRCLDLRLFQGKIVDVCYFRDYRDPQKNFDYSDMWYHVWMGKLAFVLVFEHMVMVVQWLLAYLIDDVPDHVQVHEQREEYLARQKFKKEQDVVSEDEQSPEPDSDLDKNLDDGKWLHDLPDYVAAKHNGVAQRNRQTRAPGSIFGKVRRMIVPCSYY